MTKKWIALWFGLGRLPFPLYRFLATLIAGFLTVLVILFAHERRKVMLTNLALCFPNVSPMQRWIWGAAHIYLYLRTFLDRGWLWSGNEPQMRDRVRYVNKAYLDELMASDQPTIFLAPHFLGLDSGGSLLQADVSMVSMYSNQKNPDLNAVMLKGRQAYSDIVLLSRQDGVRPLIKAMREGRALYYLPDMDFGEKDSVFVPFFGIKAATLTAVARLSKMLKARVIPVTTRYKDGRYYVTIHPPLENFPLEDDESSTAVVNQHIEQWVQQNVPQYLWTHKRFKTRPEGESKYY